MLYILLCVLMNAAIFTCFRLFASLRIDVLQAIVINYIICVATGILFMGGLPVPSGTGLDTPWVVIAIFLGAIFMGTFYLMAVTTHKFSMTVSSIATKMSLVVPVLFSLLILEVQSKPYTWLNYAGMLLALLAIFMSSYKKRKIEKQVLSGFELLLPLFIFLLGGIIDSTINYTNYYYLSPGEAPLFPLFIFTSAAVIGSVVLIIKRRRLTLRNFAGGLALGVVNYFSMYFLLASLNFFENDGAVVYPLVNVGIIIFSSGISVFFFKEGLSGINRAGLVVALAAIILISYQEILMML